MSGTGGEGDTSDEGPTRAIAGLLGYGTWLASASIAAGLAFQWLHPLSRTVLPAVVLSRFDPVKWGVALFILLPVCRVALMLAHFVYERDAAYAAIAALVLAIMGAGFLAGL